MNNSFLLNVALALLLNVIFFVMLVASIKSSDSEGSMSDEIIQGDQATTAYTAYKIGFDKGLKLNNAATYRSGI